MHDWDIKKREREITEISQTSGMSSVFIERCMLFGDIIRFISSDNYLYRYLALKGGTVINYCHLNLPRISNDIDFDFCRNIDFQGIDTESQIVNEKLQKLLFFSDRIVSVKKIPNGNSCSFDYRYINLNGIEDSIFLDINFLKRIHIFDYENISIHNSIIASIPARALNIIEVIAGKINVLLERRHAKDFFDIFNILKSGLLINKALLRKCIVYYNAISNECNIDRIKLSDLNVSENSLGELNSMLSLPETINISFMHEKVIYFLKEVLILKENDRKFIDDYRNNIYSPEQLFDDCFIIGKLRRHPMALLAK